MQDKNEIFFSYLCKKISKKEYFKQMSKICDDPWEPFRRFNQGEKLLKMLRKMKEELDKEERKSRKRTKRDIQENNGE